MQVISLAKAGVAHIADDLARGYILAGRDDVAGHVHVDGLEAVTVDMTRYIVMCM